MTKKSEKISDLKEEKKPVSKKEETKKTKTSAKKAEKKVDLNLAVAEPEVKADMELPEQINKPIRKRTARKPKEEKPSEDVKYSSIEVGIASDDIGILRSDKDVRLQREEELYRSLVQYSRDKQVLWGTITSVSSIGKHAIINVYWNGFDIMIRDSEYFEANFDFGKRYLTMKDDEKLAFRRATASHHLGALVAFCVLTVQKTLIKDGAYENEFSYQVVGSRTAAMEILRDIFFIHKNRKKNAQIAPRSCKVGDIQYAHVIGVKEEFVLVECCGVETRIHNVDLAFDVPDNCEERYSAGDVIQVRVRGVSVKDNKVELSLSGKLNLTPKNIINIKENALYPGKVARYNPNKKCYLVILDKTEVQVTIPENRVGGRLMLYPGDKVRVKIYRKHDDFVIGSAIKV